MGNKRVPELRFTAFSAEWEEMKLGDLYNVYSGQTPLRSDSSNFDNPNTAWIKTTDLNNSAITINEENISEKAAKKLKVLKSDTVLIAMYGGFNQIGRTGLLTYTATINQAISALEPIDKVVPYFLLTELNFRVREWQRLAASSRKDPNITKRDVESFIFKFPSYDEQIKIGNFFKHLDDTISIHQQELNTLKQTKQGFLQKMLPKEGELLPEIRFPGFTGEWEYCKWIDTVDISTNMVDPRMEKYQDLPHIGPGNIESFTGRILDNVKSVKEDNLISGKFYFKAGDVIYGKINPQLGKYTLPEFEGLASADAYVLNTKNGLTQKFLFCILQGMDFYKYSVSVSMRTGMPKINRNELNQYKFLSPTLKEQQKIGNFFKQLDDAIALHEQELETLKQTKKAFLQKMFV